MQNSPRGYPELAAFLDSDDNFMIYRRFGFLHARILLNKQDELRVIGKTLDTMDEIDGRSEDSKKCLQSRSKDEARAREEARAQGEARAKDNTRQLGQGRKTRKQLLKEAEDIIGEYRNDNSPPISGKVRFLTEHSRSVITPSTAARLDESTGRP